MHVKIFIKGEGVKFQGKLTIPLRHVFNFFLLISNQTTLGGGGGWISPRKRLTVFQAIALVSTKPLAPTAICNHKGNNAQLMEFQVL